MSTPRAVAYGEGAAFVDLGIEALPAPDRAARTHALAAALRAALPAADVVVGAGTIAVIGAAVDDVARVAEGGAKGAAIQGVSRSIEVIYDGPDRDELASLLGVSADEVVRRHTAAEYLVELLGFMPGFAYLAPLGDWGLTAPRRATPRPRVLAGSVGVAGGYTGIYPFASSGGWNLIGRAARVSPFDPGRDPPGLFQPGDRVRFVAAHEEVALPMEQAARAPASQGLAVIAAAAIATIQDRGRHGRLGLGLPPSGALDPATLAAANVAVGNPAGAAAIEVMLGSLEIQAKGPVIASIDGEPARSLADGERLRIPAGEAAVRYVAVRGGCDVPRVLGARATLPIARLGGLDGRALERGDVVGIGGAGDEVDVSEVDRDPEGAPLTIDPGPHLARFPEGAIDVLLGNSWVISRLGDRVGVRLEGGRVPREGPDLALPVPMVRGAIEVSTDGTPIVLGPDHPTTGGYPVLAVLRQASQAALARRRPGGAVRFRLG